MAKKNKKKIFERNILNLLKQSEKGLSAKSLSKLLDVHKAEYRLFRDAIDNLKCNHLIQKDKKTNNFFIAEIQKFVEGELRIARGGFGFVIDKSKNDDIFIGRDHLNTAFDRDIVHVKLYAKSKGKRREGFVTKVIKRFRKTFVGTFHLTKYYGYVVPDDPKIYRDFFIPKEKYGKAENGQKVLISLDEWKSDHQNPEGSIVEILGFPGDKGVDIASIAGSFQLGLNFSEKVENEAKDIQYKFSESELKSRLDFREENCITIDPEDAKDFDDAVTFKKLDNGNIELGVHIADVSLYVTENTSIDKEAFKRGTSVYLVDRVIPMLPEHLSNELCSLQPHTDRLTFSCVMEFSPAGDLINYIINPSIIHSKRRFNYEEVQSIIDNKANDTYYSFLKNMMQFSKVLTKKRLGEGGIDFETPEVEFELDDTGFPTAIHRKQRLDSHRLIEEFMLAANRTVSEHIKKISTEKFTYPFIYRVHEKPDSEKMKKFLEFLKSIGYQIKFDKKDISSFFQKLLNDIKGTKEEIVIEEIALRSMMKAIYDTKNVGHFGLGFEDYTHFTSPIRRYPDLVVHRLLKIYQNSSSIDKNVITKKLKKICEQSSTMEKLALEAERESVRLKQNEFISLHIGEEFVGVISGVMSFGIFVELVDNLVEGLIHITNLDDDYYIFDEKSYSLIGRDTNRILRLGDTIRITVDTVNLEVGKVDFRLVT
jgi:ribonuclease R